MSPTKHCIHCGKPGPFSTPNMQTCVACEALREEERKAYHRNYQRARGMAISKLIEKHPREFERLMVESRVELENILEEEDTKSSAGNGPRKGR